MSTFMYKEDHSVKRPSSAENTSFLSHVYLEKFYVSVDTMVIYILVTFLLSFPRARQLIHIESLHPLEQNIIDAAFKELRKETHCRIWVFENPQTINCWEVTHRRFSDLFKRQTNQMNWVILFLGKIFCTYCGRSYNYMKCTLPARVRCLGRSINLLLPYRTSISSKLYIFVDLHLKMWNTHAPQFLLTEE
jgi:hypothetical protein